MFRNFCSPSQKSTQTYLQLPSASIDVAGSLTLKSLKNAAVLGLLAD